MDYPSYFAGWHSIISGGHILSVLGFGFFLLMLIDSFYCGLAPKKRTLGVSRLGNRLSFYAYERKKLNQNVRNKLIVVNKVNQTVSSENELIFYTFK